MLPHFNVNGEISHGGLTLLMHCAQFGSLKCLEFLIDSGADVNQQDSSLRTALHFACAAGNREIVVALSSTFEAK